MAIKEYNVDLDVKGKVLATTVPNSTGSIVTWNSSTNVFGLRTNAQIIADLNLALKSELPVYTSSLGISKVGTDFRPSYGTAANTIAQGNDSRINNGQTAFGWGDFRDYGLGKPSINVADVNDITLNARFYRMLGSVPNNPIGAGAFLNMPYQGGKTFMFRVAATSASVGSINRSGTVVKHFDFWTSLDFTQTNISNWNMAFGWGNHVDAGYVPYTGATTNVNLGTRSITSTGGFLGNATTATTATYLTRAGGSITTAPATYGLRFDTNIRSITAGIFPTSNNSNSVITLNRHPGNYDSQLGFSSDGNLYYRAFANAALNTTQSWKTLLDSDNYSSIIHNNYITTNTTQTGLTGSKTSSGIWTFSSDNATSIRLIRERENGNVTLSYQVSGQTVVFTGTNAGNYWAIGSSADMSNISSRWMWVDNTGTIFSKIHGNSSQWKQAFDWGNHDGQYVSNKLANLGYTELFSGDLNTLPNGSYIQAIGGASTNGASGIGTPRSLISFGARNSSDTSLQSDILIGTSGFAVRNRQFNNWMTAWHSGNLANGTTAQYIRGDGSLATYANTTYTAGTGLSLTGTTFVNTAPNATHTGDVTGATALTIANSAVTHAKYQNIATQRILGRGAAGAGNVQELTLGSNLTLSTAGVLSATNTNTTYTAGTGLSLSGTTFGQTITTSGSGGFVTGVTQTANGFQVNLGTPPNTTYSNMSLAEATAGTVTTARTISSKTLNDWINAMGISSGILEYSPQGGIQTIDWNSYALGDKSIAVGSVTMANGFAQIAIGTQVSLKGTGTVGSGFTINDEGIYNSLHGAYLYNRADNAVINGLGLRNYQSGHIVTGQYNDFETENYDVSLSLSKPEAVPLFTLGNGTSDLTRSNAFRIYREGSMELYGRGFYREDKRDSSWFTKNNTLADVQYVNEAIASSGSSYTLPIATTSVRGGLRTTTGTTAGYDINASTGIMTMRYASPTQKGMIRVGNGLVIDINGILSTTGGGGGGYVDPIAAVGIQNSEVNIQNINWSGVINENLLGSGEIIKGVTIDRKFTNVPENYEYQIVVHDYGVWKTWEEAVSDAGYPGKMDQLPTIFGIVINTGSTVKHTILLKGWVYGMPGTSNDKTYAYLSGDTTSISFLDSSKLALDKPNFKMIGFSPDSVNHSTFYFNPWMT